MRSPSVHNVFKVSVEPGLTNVLAGECSLEDAIVTSWSKNVHLLPAGKLMTSPHKLLGNGAWKSLMAKIPASYRYVVIDTPPVLAASEALVLARAADASLVCVMCDVSRVDQVRKAIERLVAAGGHPVGAVLNGVPSRHYASATAITPTRKSKARARSLMDQMPSFNEPSESPRTPSRSAAKPRTRRILNVRLLVETLIIAAILGPAIYGWYSWQLKRTATAMLERAAKLTEDKDDAAAAQYYFQYLKLRPDNVDVQVLLAESFDRAAKVGGGRNGLDFYYQALGVAPDDKQRELRCGLAEVLVQLGQFAKAEEEGPHAVDSEAQCPTRQFHAKRHPRMAALGAGALRTIGRRRHVQGHHQSRHEEPGSSVPHRRDGRRRRPRQGREGHEKEGRSCHGGRGVRAGTEAQPGRRRDRVHPGTHLPQATAIARQAATGPFRQGAGAIGRRHHGRDGGGQSQSAKARLAHYQYRTVYGLANAEEDLAAALKDNPNNLAVVLQAADRAERDGELAKRDGAPAEKVKPYIEQAVKNYNRAIEISPSGEAAYVRLGELYRRQGKYDRAQETWRFGLEKGNKESTALNTLLAELFLTQGKLDDADKTIRELDRIAEQIGSKPGSPQANKSALKFKRFPAGKMAGRQAAVHGGDSAAAAGSGRSTIGRRGRRPHPASLAIAGKRLCRPRPVGPSGNGLRACGRSGAEGRLAAHDGGERLGYGRTAGGGGSTL